jgi:DNA invertase Pin-like site-specific DNA recombinase
MEQVVAYLRVSTQRQGASGLGLDAQREAVAAYCKQHGCEVSREFQEIESGKNNDRKVLAEAMRFAKRTRSTLVIGKLDRLARNVHFISGLMESDVDFAACDLPQANRLLLHIMAAVAEAEAKAISDRTTAALKVSKSNGTKLGATNPKSRNMTTIDMAAGRKLGVAAIKQKANAFHADVLPDLIELREDGLTLAEIADTMNDRNQFQRNGKPWSAVQVSRVLAKA